jgi:hypothetical protein
VDRLILTKEKWLGFRGGLARFEPLQTARAGLCGVVNLHSVANGRQRNLKRTAQNRIAWADCKLAIDSLALNEPDLEVARVKHQWSLQIYSLDMQQSPTA